MYPTPVAYAAIVGIGALACTLAVLVARRRPTAGVRLAKGLALLLVAKQALWVYTSDVAIPFQWSFGLPFQLCDFAVLVAIVACWWRTRWLVELLWFWALAGVSQALATPELSVGFPHLLFLQYLIGHVAVLCAAFLLVVGLGLTPRRGAVARVFGLTVAYAVVVGAVDALTGGDYLWLAAPPPTASLLSVLGPWPWYILSSAALALVLFVVLDLPFRAGRRRSGPVGAGPEQVLAAGSAGTTSAAPGMGCEPLEVPGDVVGELRGGPHDVIAAGVADEDHLSAETT
jgi:hypothetical integral membrane protein (TIGR02206 family)